MCTTNKDEICLVVQHVIKVIRTKNITTNIQLSLYTMLCPINVNTNAIELIMHTSCYCVLDLLCVTWHWPNQSSKIQII